ncbi:hypothetical protein SAMN04487975_10289 [Planococcus glaciei]|uniref:hypothetical protein n=1 Tax=Planococcus glaciei TaxID=459472 RepID=UPI0008831469|nr:hypothetical protein [Planococcus glaciei]SDG95937.1 hypothetical protein SAMN04487975_10289 [Planococcus glaciei]
MKHQISIIDYVEQGSSLYIELEVRDAETGSQFREEVRFLDDLLYGELVHPKKSPLSESCRIAVIAYLKNHFNR